MSIRQFRHVPIEGKRNIRVIHLDPAANCRDPICCSLKVISIDELFPEPEYQHLVGDYEALSYAWDDQIADQAIECDNQQFLVTKNVRTALQSLRYPDKMRSLWIDSICINQDKSAGKEKSDQVSMMGEIYSRAFRVVIWLGDSDSRILIAMKLINDIGWKGSRDSRENTIEALKICEYLL